jgi:importin-7
MAHSTSTCPHTFCIRIPQVDAWLGPFLSLGLAKLATAENRVLRDQLLLLVANALYYNAAATLTLISQSSGSSSGGGGGAALQQLFGLWFSCIFARRHVCTSTAVNKHC